MIRNIINQTGNISCQLFCSIYPPQFWRSSCCSQPSGPRVPGSQPPPSDLWRPRRLGLPGMVSGSIFIRFCRIYIYISIFLYSYLYNIQYIIIIILLLLIIIVIIIIIYIYICMYIHVLSISEQLLWLYIHFWKSLKMRDWSELPDMDAGVPLSTAKEIWNLQLNMFAPTRPFAHIQQTHSNNIIYLSQEDEQKDWLYAVIDFRFHDLGL